MSAALLLLLDILHEIMIQQSKTAPVSSQARSGCSLCLPGTTAPETKVQEFRSVAAVAHRGEQYTSLVCKESKTWFSADILNLSRNSFHWIFKSVMLLLLERGILSWLGEVALGDFETGCLAVYIFLIIFPKTLITLLAFTNIATLPFRSTFTCFLFPSFIFLYLSPYSFYFLWFRFIIVLLIKWNKIKKTKWKK